MNSAFFRILNYLRYSLTAGDEHSIHSPFVYSLYTSAIHNDNQYYAFPEIEALRKTLRANTNEIAVTDFGAGSSKLKGNQRKISSIARHSLKERKVAQTIFKIATYLKAKHIVELGSCLGITTAYLASTNRNSKVFSLEGCPNLSDMANKALASLDIKNAQIVTGKIEDTLMKVLEQAGTVDLVFFDANHRLEPTLNYFELCLPYRNNNSVFIFDDIYWSDEMKQAWNIIKAHPDVTLSIDLFHIGLVFFRTNAPKQHFTLKL